MHPPARALAREQDLSFERLYVSHRPAVYGLVLRDLRNPDEAEDVTQVTFLNAYRALRRGDAPESPRAWLLTIARNVCRRRFRLEAGRPQEVELNPELVGVDDYDGPTAAEIRAALRRLKPSHRAVILLREFWGLNYAEIAEKLGVSHAAVETLLFRARRRLREELEAGQPQPERPRRSVRGIFALPLPAGLLNAFDSLVFTLSRTGIAARTAGLVAAAALGTGVAVGVNGAEPASPKPSVAVEQSTPAASADELSLHELAAAQAAAAAAGERSAPEAPNGSAGLQDKAVTSASSPLPLEAPSVETPGLTTPEIAVPLPEVQLPEVPPLPTVDADTASIDLSVPLP